MRASTATPAWPMRAHGQATQVVCAEDGGRRLSEQVLDRRSPGPQQADATSGLESRHWPLRSIGPRPADERRCTRCLWLGPKLLESGAKPRHELVPEFLSSQIGQVAGPRPPEQLAWLNFANPTRERALHPRNDEARDDLGMTRCPGNRCLALFPHANHRSSAGPGPVNPQCAALP